MRLSLLDYFKKRREEVPFLIFTAFLVSFLVARVYFLLLGTTFDLGEYTLYHLYLGVFLIIAAGWIAINYEDRDLTRITAVIFGLGLGAFFDQVGFMLTHFGNYQDGLTYTVVTTVSLLLLNVVFFDEFWSSVGSNLRDYAERKEIRRGPFNMMGLIDVVERIAGRMPGTGRISMAFTGIVFLVSGAMVLEYPSLVHYWISGAFVLTGLFYLVRGLRSGR